MPACVCDPTVVDGFHYSEWVATFSGECVYTPLEFTAFLCGLLALACFIVGLLPQMYKNYQRGDVEGLSLGLLIIWATGDVTGFLGAILTPQSVTLRLCSAYFVFLSICSFAQYAYYSNKTALRKLQIEDGDETSTLISEVVDVPEDDRGSVTPASHRSQGYGALDKVVVVSTVMIGLLALAGATEALVIGADGHGEGSSAAMPICGDVAPQTPSARHIGEVAAWISGIMYFSSRYVLVVVLESA
ncbi:PQ loop repeat-containing protein 2 [Thoreauomyces humboldtii]|nr:PQ loop repeat-containing protein 2 [Thoreauomyces humboldtii]